ncbi:MAG: alpha/beta hydrolase [Ignavibacteria bacterium]
MNNFKINGISVTDYEGKGKPLIFVHAYPLCSRMWDIQVDFFKDKYRVITYDVRGLGYSNELDDYQFTMEELVNDFFSILDHMKINKVNACGLSMGGYILLRATVRDQSRFSSIILADTKATGDDNEGLLNRASAIIKIKAGQKDEFLLGFLKKLLSEKGFQDEKIKNFVSMMMGWMDVRGLVATMIAIATRTSTFFQLKDLNIPALVIAGRKDAVLKVTDSFFIKENIKNSVFKVIHDAGHLSNIEKPEEFNISMEDFLSNLKN